MNSQPSLPPSLCHCRKVLNGPYVAEFFSTFEDAQCIFIVMELCEGGDLFKTMLMHGGLLDEQWVCVEVRPRRGDTAAAMLARGLRA